MRDGKVAVATLSVALLGLGCVMFTGMPMTPEAFREAVRGGAMFTEVRNFEAARSLRRAVATVEKKARECFNVVVETTSSSNMSYSHYTNTYTPSVVKGTGRAELHLQQKTRGNVLSPREPEAGHYIMVVDMLKKSRSSIGVEMYVPTVGYDPVVEAVESWIRGTSGLCPDLR